MERLPAFTLLLGDAGVFERCKSELGEIAAKLEKSGGGGGDSAAAQSKMPMRQFGFRALKWPFTGKEIKSSIVVLERCKASFNLALNADQARLTLDTSQLLVDLEKCITASLNDKKEYTEQRSFNGIPLSNEE